MLKLAMTALVLSAPVFAQAEVQREINGVTYYLSNDFDSADGECVLRGKSYASSFYSFSSQTSFIAKLNSNGTVKELIGEGSAPMEVIAGVNCE